MLQNVPAILTVYYYFVGTCLLHLRTTSHLPTYNGSVIDENNFRAIAMLTVYNSDAHTKPQTCVTSVITRNLRTVY